MPIYEYQCLDCGHTFEKLQSLQESPASCPACGKEARRVMSASVGYVMKGTSHGGGGRGARDGGSCCGQSSPCANPKRCCTK
jgi:putative FmdB family regulatory protein